MDLLRDYWAIVITAAGYVLWLGRLESRANNNTRDLERLEKRLEKQREEDMESNKSHRDEMKETLKSIQNDIKLLLQRHSQ